MTAPNRPPFPDWYQHNRQVPPHVGPTQREVIARRIRSLRRFLLGASLIGVATFTTLAAYHTESKNNAAAAAEQSAPATVTQQNAVTTSTQAPSASLFNDEETHGFTAESHEGESESDGAVAQAAAPTTSQSQPAPSTSQPTTTQPTTPQITASRHRSRSGTS